MEKTIVTTGKTIELAVEAALTKLGLEMDDITYQVLALPKAGFLGFGAQPAKVIVTYQVPDPEPEKAPQVKSALGSASRSKPKATALPKAEKKPEAPKAEKKPEPVKAPEVKAEASAAPAETNPADTLVMDFQPPVL